MKIVVLALMMSVSGFGYSKRLDCQLAPKGALPAVPKYQFEIGREQGNPGYVLKLSPLRPLGVPPRFEAMNLVGTIQSAALFTATEATVLVVSEKNSQRAVLVSSGLTYRCTSPKEICASGEYNAETDRCTFGNSVTPIP